MQTCFRYRVYNNLVGSFAAICAVKTPSRLPLHTCIMFLHALLWHHPRVVIDDENVSDTDRFLLCATRMKGQVIHKPDSPSQEELAEEHVSKIKCTILVYFCQCLAKRRVYSCIACNEGNRRRVTGIVRTD